MKFACKEETANTIKLSLKNLKTKLQKLAFFIKQAAVPRLFSSSNIYTQYCQQPNSLTYKYITVKRKLQKGLINVKIKSAVMQTAGRSENLKLYFEI